MPICGRALAKRNGAPFGWEIANVRIPYGAEIVGEIEGAFEGRIRLIKKRGGVKYDV